VTDALDLAAATGIVAELTHAAPELEGRLITVPVTDPSMLAAVVRRLDDARIGVAELALRSASLNEVFLSLTGQPLEDDEDTESGQT
jgi:oleandomycin transport system ATP-binding protein